MSIIKYRDNESSPWQTIDIMKGRDAIHVGPSAPTDPEIDMWLDTDEPGQTVVTSVNGMSGAVTIPKIEVEEQTATTGTTQYQGHYYVDLVFSKDPTVFSVSNATSNRPAFAIRIAAKTIRAYTTVASTTVTVSALFVE